MGVGFADRESAQTMAHELGHNHGRNHAPCVPNGGSISGVDPNYPFPDGRTGVIGYDARTKVLLSADKGTDLMGYCSNVWLSEYTYGGITDRVALVNGNTTQALNTTPRRTWRVLLLGSNDPRWGMPITRPSLPEGEAVTANILDAKGALLTQADVYRTEVSDSGSAGHGAGAESRLERNTSARRSSAGVLGVPAPEGRRRRTFSHIVRRGAEPRDGSIPELSGFVYAGGKRAGERLGMRPVTCRSRELGLK
jgi:hypothetical protein